VESRQADRAFRVANVSQSTAAAVRSNGPFGIGGNSFHDLSRWWDVMDQRAGFTRDNSGNAEVAALARQRVIALDVFGLCFQLRLASQPLLEMGVAQNPAGIGFGPAVAP